MQPPSGAMSLLDQKGVEASRLRCRETKPQWAPLFLSPQTPRGNPGRGETRTRGAHRAVGHEVSSGVEGTSGAANQRDFRERRWKAALTARRIFGSGGPGMTIRPTRDFRVTQSPEMGRTGPYTKTIETKVSVSPHGRASPPLSRQRSMSVCDMGCPGQGRLGKIRDGVRTPTRGLQGPSLGSATPELQSLVGRRPKGHLVSLRAAVRRRNDAERLEDRGCARDS
jgi:hypothetical protein